MDSNKKKKIVIWVSITMLLGVGGYFAYTKLIKPKLDKKKAEEEAKKLAESSSSTSTSTSSGNSGSIADTYESARATATKDKKLAFKFGGKIYSTQSGKIVPNPFKTKEQLKAAQTYVYYTLKDTAIGIPDGDWGLKSATAYLKYGQSFFPTGVSNPSGNTGGGTKIYTYGLLVPTFNSPDIMSYFNDTFALSDTYVGTKVGGVVTNGIGTSFYKFLRDGKYGYIRTSQATEKPA